MEKSIDLKAIYNKGYKDGQEALAYHIELCKDEESIITVPKNATNGNVMLKLFPNSKYKIVHNGIEFKGIIDDNTEFTTWFPIEWWNAPYVEGKKEQPKQIAYNVGGHTYGVIGGDEIMKEFEG